MLLDVNIIERVDIIFFCFDGLGKNNIFYAEGPDESFCCFPAQIKVSFQVSTEVSEGDHPVLDVDRCPRSNVDDIGVDIGE